MIDAVSPANVAELGATEISTLVRAGAFDPSNVARVTLERIEATEPTLRAFISVDRAPTLASDGCDGLLAGVPVAIKDNLDVAGFCTTAGSRVLGHAGRKADVDAAAVARWRAAGALIVGKTNLHEFAYGATGVNPRWSTPANPWNSRCIPGGSSSGSAVSVAARQVPLALGTDAAGSIRMPASLCGIVGLKPTRGRVSTRGLLASHNASLDHVGPLARRVADVALGLQACAGYDALDSTSLDEPVPDYVAGLGARSDLRGLRVGVPRAYLFERVDPEVEHGVRLAIDHLTKLGATLVTFEIADLEDMMAARLALFADGLVFHLPHLVAHPELYSREIRHRLYTDVFVTAHDYARAARVRTILRDRFAAAFRDDKLDVLAMPTTPVTALPLDQWLLDWPGRGEEPVGLALLRLTAPFNLTGLPAISVPAGFTDTNLPFGLQLVARPFAECLLLQVAHHFEQTTAWHERRPPDVES